MINAGRIAALRNCSDGICSLCPYDDNEISTKGCTAKLMRDAADALEAAEKRIAELEAQLPKEGEWTVCGMFDDFLKCSICGRSTPWTTEKYYYCPNCGARMDGAE